MKHFAGLDVSLEWTSVCVVGGDGQIVREAKVLSEPDALAAFFAELGVDMTRICLEAGPLSQWLDDGLAEAGLPVVCAETRQLKAVLSTTVNKSDRNDARGIAQMVRVDMIRPVHVKRRSSRACSSARHRARRRSSCRSRSASRYGPILSTRERGDVRVRRIVLENEKPFVPLLLERARSETQLFVKEVIAGGVRYIVCRNEAEAEKDRADRLAIVDGLQRRLK